MFGLSAVGVLALLYCRPDFARQVSDFLHPQRSATMPLAASAAVHPAVPASVAIGAKPAGADSRAAAMAATATAPDDKAAGHATRQQKYVTDWLSRRYRVAGDAANMLVSTAYSTAHDIKLDPLLILAVMAIESGLNPFAESPVGAQGLMQVMSKVHRDKFAQVGGAKAALNPVANIRVGALILKDYVKRTGSVEGGLKSYVGAGPDDNSGYGSKVLAEYRRLKQVAIGKSVPIYTATPTPAAAVSPTTLAQKAPVASVAADSGGGETAHGASQGGETVAGL